MTAVGDRQETAWLLACERKRQGKLEIHCGQPVLKK